MYTFTFVYDSRELVTDGHHNELEITVDMRATRDDYEVVKVSIYDLTTHKTLDFDKLMPTDQKHLDDAVELQAYNHAGSAYIDGIADNYFLEDS